MDRVIARQDLDHSGQGRAVGSRRQQKVEVVGPQYVRVHGNLEFVGSFLQPARHDPEVRITEKDITSAVSTMNDVHRISRDELANRPTHGALTRKVAAGWHKWCLTPFVLLCACQAIDPHNMIGRQMVDATPLPTEFVPSPPPATLGAPARARA